MRAGVPLHPYPNGTLRKLLIPKLMIDKELLEILVCPETGEPLEEVDQETVTRLNGLVEFGTLVDRSGEPVSEKIEGGLLCRNGKYLYPVRENIPILLIESSIPVS